MASVGQPPSHNLHSGQEQDCKISSSNHLNSPGGQNIAHSENFSDDSNNSVSAGDANLLCDNNTTATGGTIDNGVAGSDSNNGYPDNGFSSSNLADDPQEHHHLQRQLSRNPSGGNNNSESSISSSTNPSSVGGAGESDVEASGESVAGANYRGSCVTEDDAGSSSHSEVRSSSPGLADADADVEDSPSGSEETGSESERGGGGGSSAGGSNIAAGINSASNSIMYAPNTVGFPPSRSSWSQSIPAGGSFGTGTKFSTGSNPFAVKGIPGGSVSSSSVPPISSPRIVLNNSSTNSGNGSACGSSGGLIGSGSLNSSSSSFASNVAAGASSSSSSGVTSGRWGSCSPQPLRPSSWNARSIIRPSALGSSLGGSGVSSSTAAPVTASPLAPSVLASHSSTNFFSQLGGAGAADSAGQTLDNNSTSSSSFVLRPPKLSTPFSLAGSGTGAAAGRIEASSTQSRSISHGSLPEPSSSSVASPPAPAATSITTKPSELMFVPLKKDEGGSVIVNTPESISITDSSVTTAGLSTSSSSTAGTFGANVNASSSGSASFSSVVAQDGERSFVFGSNLRERAAGGATGESTSNGISSSTSEGGLFSAALKNVQPMPSTSSSSAGQEVSIEPGSSTFGDESHSDRKRRFDDTPVITGEEDEFNVLQITCRLFAYDSTNCSWIERGRGQLRLNDRTESNNDLQSRVIVRTKGSLRLMLNTNVWGGMKVDRASPKSVRFTANDNGQIRLFLVMATVGEAEQLFQALDWRVKNQKTVEEKGSGGSGEASSSTDSAAAAAVEASSDDVSQSIQVSSRRRMSLIGNETGKLTSSDDDEESDDDDVDDDDDEDKELRTLPPKKKRFSNVDSATVGNVVVGGEGSNGSSSSYNNTNFSGRPTPPIIRINNHEMNEEEDEELN